MEHRNDIIKTTTHNQTSIRLIEIITDPHQSHIYNKQVQTKCKLEKEEWTYMYISMLWPMYFFFRIMRQTFTIWLMRIGLKQAKNLSCGALVLVITRRWDVKTFYQRITTHKATQKGDIHAFQLPSLPCLPLNLGVAKCISNRNLLAYLLLS